MSDTIPKMVKRLPRRLRKLVEQRGTDHLIDLLQISVGEAALDEHLVAQFDKVVAQFGEAFYHENYLLSRCKVYSAQAVLFVADGDEWYVDDIQTALPAFGFDTLEAVTAELKALAASSTQPAISAIFFASPVSSDVPFMLFSVFSDQEGNIAVGFGHEEVTRWTSIDAPPVAFILRRLLDLDFGRLDHQYFNRAAERLIADLGDRSNTTPADRQRQEKHLTAWLQREMREVGSNRVRDLSLVIATLTGAMENMRESYRHRSDEQTSSLEKAHAKQVKRLTAQLEKADMLVKGSQARANQLSAQVKSLRQQLSRTGPRAAGPADKANTMGEALDLLFD